jgi:hypothetical protein
MGFLDRAKRFFGVGGSDDEPAEGGESASDGGGAGRTPGPRGAPAGASRSGADPRRGRARGDRPPLAEAPPAESRGVDEALAAREAGDGALARQILREIDRGGGLRTVLRAAAALEAGDERELADLLPAVAGEAPRWRLLLQVAAALSDAEAAAPYVARAEAEGAPAWAIAWTRAMSASEAARREGLVDLLVADAALARTVAARDLGIAGAAAESDALQRYTGFAHGRDSIRRFGAGAVAALLDRAGVR